MLEFTKDNFETDVLQGEGLILVDYYGDACEPCKALMPDIVALSEEFEGKLAFGKFNTTAARRLAISQKILGLPTITLYRGGQKVGELTKEDANKENIKKMIESNL